MRLTHPRPDRPGGLAWPAGASGLWQRLAFLDKESRHLAQRRGEGEKLRGPNLMAKCLVIQAQCTGGGDGRGKVSGLRDAILVCGL